MNIKEILNEEDIKFLKEIAHELKTQDTCGTSKPVIYKISDTRVRFDDDDSDGFDTVKIYDNDGNVLDTLEEMQDHIIKFPYEFELEDASEETIKSYDIDDIVSIYKEAGFYVSYGHYERELKNAFITKKSAEQHLTENAHHYNEKAHLYVSYVWRNPTLEKLLNIIEKFDF